MGVHMRERRCERGSQRCLMLPVVSFVGLCVTHLSLLMTTMPITASAAIILTALAMSRPAGRNCMRACDSFSERIETSFVAKHRAPDGALPVSIACGRDPPWHRWR
jgi:hypothetical protein